jgi:hypothetical protein
MVSCAQAAINTKGQKPHLTAVKQVAPNQGAQIAERQTQTDAEPFCVFFFFFS